MRSYIWGLVLWGKYNFTYQGIKLCDYCKTHNINIHLLYNRLRHWQISNKFQNLSNDERIALAINKYFERDNIKQIKAVFKLLKQDISNETIRLVCKCLSINYSELRKSKYQNFNIKYLIFATWYSFDLEDANGKYISIMVP